MCTFNLIAPDIAQYCDPNHYIIFYKYTYYETSSEELRALVRNFADNISKIFSVTLPSPEKIPMSSLGKPITPKTQIRFLLKHHYCPVFEKETLTFSNDLTPEIPPIAPFLERAISAIQKEISSQEDSFVKGLRDSVSLEKFKEPMSIVDCGHTFEKTSLDNIMNEENKVCPNSSTPITDLKPTFIARDCVETFSYRCSVPIPPFLEGKQCDENPEIVEMHHNLGKAYLKKGALVDARNAYSNALKDTQEISAYEPIPELYSRENKPLHAALAYLYLAKVQLQKQSEKVLETIRKAINLNSSFPDSLELEAIFSLHNNENKTAYDLFYVLAKNYDEQKKTQEVSNFYENALLCHPDSDRVNKIFRKLIDLYDDPIKKETAYIRAILYFRNDFFFAKDFYEKARKTFPNSSYIILAFLSIMSSHDQNRYAPYRSLAELYKKTDRFAEYTIVLQKLIRFKQDRDFEELSERLVDQPNPLEKLFIQWIDHTIEKKEFSRAEEITQMALIKLPKTFSLLQRLYNLVQEPQIQEPQKVVQATSQLGQFYEQQKQLDKAETFYREAFQLQKTCQTTSQLADLLFQQGHREESIRLYFDASSHSFIHNDFTTTAHYYRNAIQLDPDLTSLSSSERILFKIASGALEVSSRYRLVTPSQNTSLAIPPSSMKPIPDMAFGKAKWKEYIGDIGEESPLPTNIEEILDSACPFFEDQPIRDTQDLLIIPKTLNFFPLNIFRLQLLMNFSKKKKNGTTYKKYLLDDYAKDCSLSKNYWILMTKKIVKTTKPPKPYDIPTLFEAVIGLFTHYLQTQEMLFYPQYIYTKSQNPRTQSPIVIGFTEDKKIDISSLEKRQNSSITNCYIWRL